MSSDGFTPQSYMTALRELRIEDEIEPGQFELYERCEGFDILAGRLVEQAVRDGLDLWHLVDTFAAVSRACAEVHEDVQQRLEVIMVLHLLSLVRELDPASVDAATRIAEEWSHQPSTDLAGFAVKLACRLIAGPPVDERHLVIQGRELVRSAHELGGMPTVRAVVEGLRAGVTAARSAG